ncbi:MAG: hypothetical protein JW981_01875 [Anaerolineae bacterium]|nr:hypothetical protein [Anaerolineae bacterium]
MDIQTGEVIRRFRADQWIRNAAFTPDAKKLLLHNNLYDTETGNKIQTFAIACQDGPFYCQAGDISSDGTKALVMRGNKVFVFDLTTGELLETFEYAYDNGQTIEVGVATFSPDSAKFAVTGIRDLGSGNQVWIEDVATLTTTLIITNLNHVHDVAFSPDSQYLVTGGSVSSHSYPPGDLWKYDLATGERVYTFSYPPNGIHQVDITQVGTQTLVIAGGHEGRQRIWDFDTGDVILDYGGMVAPYETAHPGDAIEFTVDGSQFVLGDRNGNVKLVDTFTGEEGRLLHSSTSILHNIARSPDGERYVLTGVKQSGDTMPSPLLLVDAKGSLIHRFGNIPVTNKAVFSPDGRYILAGTDYEGDSTLYLLSAETYEIVRTFKFKPGEEYMPVKRVGFAPNGQWVAAATDDTISIFNTTSGALLQYMEYGAGEIGNMAISPDGTQIAVAKTKIAHNDEYNVVFLWDVATGQLIRGFKGPFAWDVTFSPDGSKLAAAMGETASLVKIWDLKTGNTLQSFDPEHSAQAYSVAFSPDGSQLATGGADYRVKLWDYASGKLLRKFQHNGNVYSVAFTPDGKYLITNEIDNNALGTGRLWALDTAPIRQPIIELTPGKSETGDVEVYTWADYVVETTAGANLLITTTVPTSGSLRIYGRLAEQPTLGRNDYKTTTPSDASDYQLLIPNTEAGKYYIGVYGESSTTTEPLPFTIRAQVVEHHLADLKPRAAGNTGHATLSIRGLGFTESGMAASLYGQETEITAETLTYQDTTALAARFNLSGTTNGSYDLRLSWPDATTATLKNAFVISGSAGALLNTELVVPPFHRPERQYVAQIRYQNVGDSDMAAPLYVLSANDDTPIVCGDSAFTGTVQVLGIPTAGDPHYIPPGGDGYIPIKYTGTQEDVNFQLDVLFPTQTPIDWDAHKDTMRPAPISTTDWDALYPTLTGQLGTTWASYLEVLAANAERLGKRGSTDYCANQLLDLEIRKAQALPTAAISGQLRDAETHQALGSILLTAITADGAGGYNYYRTITNFANGHFVLNNLPTGLYTITAEGYYFPDTTTFEIKNDQDIVGQQLLVTPIPIPTEESDPVIPTANHHPALAVDGDGNAVMVWQRYGQLWAAVYDPESHQWQHSGVISGSTGEAPALAYADQITNVGAGFVALWRSGSGNSGRLHYSIITRDGDNNLAWREAITLTNAITGTAGDTAPAITVLDNGDPLALWIRKDWAAQDDTDLYYQSFTPPTLRQMTLEVIVPLEDLADFARSPLAPLAEHCVAVTMQQGESLPSWVPIIGGKYGFEVNGSGCAEIGCELGISGNLEIGVDFSDNVSGSGSAGVGATWATNQETCAYVFEKGSLGLSVGAEGKVPAFKFSIPLIVNLEAGAVIGGDVAGTVYWNGGNFPGYPNKGEVEVTAKIGPYGKAEFIKIIEAELQGTGQVKAKYVTPSTFSFEGWCLNLNANAKTWLLSYSFDKSWGPACEDRVALTRRATAGIPARQIRMMVNQDIQDDVPVTEILTIQVAEQVGAGNVYTHTGLAGNPVLMDTITGDLTNDGNPAIASSPGGETLIVWTKDAADQNTSVGSSVVVANYDGLAWTQPLTLTGSDQFNRHPDVAFVDGEVALAVWAGSDAGAISLSSTITEVLDAIDAADIYHAIRITDTWSTPAPLNSHSGTDERPHLATDGKGNATVVWTHVNSESDDTLYTTSWDGSAWSTITAIEKPAGIVESLDVAYNGTLTQTPLLVWAQDTDGNPATQNDLVIYYTIYSGTTWLTPEMIPQATSLVGTPPAEAQRSTYRYTNWNQAFGITPCAANFISPPEDCCPKEDPPQPTPPPPPPPPPDNKPQPVQPNNDNEQDTTSYTINQGKSTSRTSNDPNEKVGPVGWDGQGSIITGTRMIYTVFFENIAQVVSETVSIIIPAPAQEVFITDQLSPKLDWTTLQFEEIAFGETVLGIEESGNSFQTQVNIPDYRYPTTTTWDVDISGQLDMHTGEIEWIFRTLDPETGLLPSDVEAGFLPANDESGRGEGHVVFSIDMQPALTIGTVITNEASIVFDTNEAIMTNVYTNIIGVPSTSIYLPLIMKQQP